MLLLVILTMFSNQGSLLGMERYAKLNRQTLNGLLATHIANPPSDATFRLLLAQLDVDGFEALLQQWMAAQPSFTESVDTLVCVGKTLRGYVRANRFWRTAFYRPGEPVLQYAGRCDCPKHLRHRCRRRDLGLAPAVGLR
jgi:hypothetical protein